MTGSAEKVLVTDLILACLLIHICMHPKSEWSGCDLSEEKKTKRLYAFL